MKINNSMTLKEVYIIFTDYWNDKYHLWVMTCLVRKHYRPPAGIIMTAKCFMTWIGVKCLGIRHCWYPRDLSATKYAHYWMSSESNLLTMIMKK